MRTFLYLVDWTPPEIIGEHLARSTGQVLAIEQAVQAGGIEGSGWSFPQHQATPDTNIIVVSCPEQNVSALQAVAGIQLLHEFENEIMVSLNIIECHDVINAVGCVVRNQSLVWISVPNIAISALVAGDKAMPWKRDIGYALGCTAFFGVVSGFIPDRKMSRRSMIGFGLAALAIPNANAAQGQKTVSKADKDTLKAFLEGKKNDSNAKLTAAQKTAWSKSGVAKIVDDVGNTDTKKLAAKVARSAMFGWSELTCRNTQL